MDQLSIAWMLALQAQPDFVNTAISAGETTTGGGTFWDNLQAFLYLLGVILAVFVLPLVVGRWLSRWLRMPDHGGKIALILGSIVGGGLIVGLKELRYGPDIKGGTNLVYELLKTEVNLGSGTDRIRASTLVPQLAQRLNPRGPRKS